MPSNDTPLIIESGDELPAGTGKPVDEVAEQVKGRKRQGLT
jgi:hypothetical protein